VSERSVNDVVELYTFMPAVSRLGISLPRVCGLCGAEGEALSAEERPFTARQERFRSPLPCAIGPGFPARNVRVTSAATLLRGKQKYVNGVTPAPEARNELAQSEASACEAVRLGKAGIIMEPRRGGTTTALQEHRT
jgi:hypothetical protein